MMPPAVVLSLALLVITELLGTIAALDIKAQLKKTAESTFTKNNPFLHNFLDSHTQPKVIYNNRDWVLNMDERYVFEPVIFKGPFTSTGEPIPMPKKYLANDKKLVRFSKDKFRIVNKGQSSDIIQAAIARYTAIILNHTLTEPYEYVFNFNSKTAEERTKAEADKYGSVSDATTLEVDISGKDTGYPHIEMDESYTLKVKPGDVKLAAPEVWGALRGLETFSQLLFQKRGSEQEFYARETDIEDEPRFAHRGILLDTARHYIQKYAIRNVLESMSYNKFNVLHWHIVDDNSFPYKSEVLPKLSEKGAYHPYMVYTLKDIKELIEYARLRGIRVVPEFDTPGHMFAWGLGYPEIKATCYQGDKPLAGPLGPIDPTLDASYDFMATLFQEVFDVFPDSFFHLGGDELQSTCWATNPQIVKFLKDNAGIGNPGNARSYVGQAIGYYFTRLVERLKKTADTRPTKKKASFIMWQDVLEHTQNIPKDSILEVWKSGPSFVRNLNQKGYRAIFSQCWYLDFYTNGIMWHKYYECDPSPYFTDAEDKGKLMGGEACLWAEYLTSDNIMTMMWPRASAPAERLWSPRNVRDLGYAGRRLQEQRCRSIARGLATGHLNGPDYCVRNKEAPLGGDDHLGIDLAYQSSNIGAPECRDPAQYVASFLPSNWGTGAGAMLPTIALTSKYQKFLPWLNVLLTILGLAFMVFVFRRLRKR